MCVGYTEGLKGFFLVRSNLSSVSSCVVVIITSFLTCVVSEFVVFRGKFSVCLVTFHVA